MMAVNYNKQQIKQTNINQYYSHYKTNPGEK